MGRKSSSGPGATVTLNDEALELIAGRFRILGEPSRLKLLRGLEAGEKSVSELMEIAGLNQANASRHLQALTRAGILGRRREGLNVFYRVIDPGIYQLCHHVCGSLAAQHSRNAGIFGQP